MHELSIRTHFLAVVHRLFSVKRADVAAMKSYIYKLTSIERVGFLFREMCQDPPTLKYIIYLLETRTTSR